MKKIAIIALISIIFIPSVSFAYITLDNSEYVVGTNIQVSGLAGESDWLAFWKDGETFPSIKIMATGSSYLLTYPFEVGDYIVLDLIAGNCDNWSLTNCRASGMYQGEASFSVIPIPPKPFESMISNATSTFNIVTGVEISDLVEWSGDNIKLVAGSGVGVLLALLPWIIGLVVIGALVYFLYRAFRFFRH